MKPFRLQFKALACVEEAVLRRNLAHAAHFPRAQPGKHEYPVAVCGGGPSLNEHLSEIAAWPGDVWAINGTADYLLDRGIACTLFCVDALVEKTTAARRLLATCCNPALFAGHVETFACCEHEEGGVPGGSTAAGRTPALALRLGYPGAVYFGCDSSFDGCDHVDRDEKLPDVMVIRANGRDFKTYPEFSMQAECLADVIRLAPDFFVNRSGGLLEAMVHDQQWSVVAVSDALKAHLIEINGDDGIYDAPYVAIQIGDSK